MNLALLLFHLLPAVATLPSPPPAGGCPLSSMTQPIVTPPRIGPREQSTLHLRLNLPSYRLEVFDGDSLIGGYRVAIGDTAYPTPVGLFEVTRVEWDPWWVPPASDWAARDTLTPPGPWDPLESTCRHASLSIL